MRCRQRFKSPAPAAFLRPAEIVPHLEIPAKRGNPRHGKTRAENALQHGAGLPAFVHHATSPPPSRRTSSLFALRRPSPLRGTDIVQVRSRSDKSEMRKRLWEVSHLPPRLRIVLFREQADIVAKRQQVFKQGARFRVAVLQRVVVGEPKTAGKEDTFSRRETVNA